MTYRFDCFTLDAGTRRLLRDGREVHLSPKALDLLLCLVENRARAMSRNELQSMLWPSTFVLETNLAGLVAEVRRALGDSADDPLFVRTMHRFGYWFIGGMNEAAAKDDAMTPAVRYWLVWDTKIVVQPGEAIVEDLGSKNGTYVGSQRVNRPRPLVDGEQIRLGPVVVTFRIPQPPGTTETDPLR